MSELRCSVGSALAGEPMAGTAPQARGWVAVEQAGPWGAKALTSSHLHPEIGAGLQAGCAAHGLRPVLIRRPGRHADVGGPRRVLVAHTSPGRSWLLEGEISHPRELLALDWPAISTGDREAVARSLPSLLPTDLPALLVCTNGSRDRCCAIDGREVAAAAAELLPGRVWETTHLSGHRFSATGVLLPTGQVHGRLTAGEVPGLIESLARGRTPIETLRGRSTWGPREQVAEIAVRQAIGEDRLDAIVGVDAVEHPEVAGALLVRHVDGRTWTVDVRVHDDGAARAESCGKALVSMAPLRARFLPAP